MIFKIKWGDFKPLLKRKHISEQETKSPVFYFENDTEIHLYQANAGYTLYSLLSKSELDNTENFKREFLPDAIELRSLPKRNVTFVIRQE